MGIPNFEIVHLDSLEHYASHRRSVGIVAAMVSAITVSNEIDLDD